jgi:hypothetical protein
MTEPECTSAEQTEDRLAFETTIAVTSAIPSEKPDLRQARHARGCYPSQGLTRRTVSKIVTINLDPICPAVQAGFADRRRGSP